MALLRPLLLDNVPSIQQSAALALGRLANYSDELAEAVVSNEILPQLVYSLSEQNVRNYVSVTLWKFQNLNCTGFGDLIVALEILQEGCRLRPQVCCQALSTPCKGCCQLWSS